MATATKSRGQEAITGMEMTTGEQTVWRLGGQGQLSLTQRIQAKELLAPDSSDCRLL